MKRFFWIYLVIAIAAIATWQFVWGVQPDPRYQGWANYQDKDGGYRLMVPAKWEVEDEMIPGVNGTRLYPASKYAGDLASFVYILVLVKDLPIGDEAKKMQDLAAKWLGSITEGIWQKQTISHSEGEFLDRPAVLFELKGLPLYSSHKLQGSAIYVQNEGSQYLLFFSGTDETWGELSENYSLIRNSFNFD